MASTDAIPVPRKNAAFRFSFAIRKPSDSTLITTWAGQDSEVSLDGAAYADCTNEATEIGTSGTGYIDLTSSEMNADCVLLKITVTNTGAVPLVFVLYPETAGDYRVADTQKVDVETIKTQAVTCAAGVTVPATIASTTNITAGTITTVTNLTNAPTSGDLTATMKTSVTTAATAATPIAASVAGAVGSVTGNVGGNVVGSVASVTGNVGGNVTGTVDSVVTKTGYALTSTGLDLVTAWTTNITGSLSGAVGSVSGNVGGSVASVTGNVGGNVTGSVGSVVGMTASDVAAIKLISDRLATMYVLDGAVYQFTANALEQGPGGSGGTSDWTADERTAIRTILGVPASGTTPEVPSAGALKVIDDLIDTEMAAANVILTNIATMYVLDGAVYQFTANALELGPGGSTSITVVPLTGVVESRVDGTTITVFTSETVTVSVACVDAEGDAVDVSAMNLEVIIENQRNADIVVIHNASITKVTSTFSFAVPISVSGTEGNYQWALRKTTDDSVLMTGPFLVVYAPQSD